MGYKEGSSREVVRLLRAVQVGEGGVLDQEIGLLWAEGEPKKGEPLLGLSQEVPCNSRGRFYFISQFLWGDVAYHISQPAIYM